MKLTEERLWCLKWWERGGWSLGRPMQRGVKKWERHIEMLAKAGLLEADGVLCRITEAGLTALQAARSKE